MNFSMLRTAIQYRFVQLSGFTQPFKLAVHAIAYRMVQKRFNNHEGIGKCTSLKERLPGRRGSSEA
ncbi:hypothetical protein [Sphaerochaeta sp.]|uniref:hypothetical protein n=1 Tax=Sphaerochaeta sp. TaxID=1972642 RepID=UPI002FCBF91C